MREGVLAAVDLLDGTEAVLTSAEVLAQRLGWPLVALHVVENGYLKSAPRRFASVWRPEYEKTLEAADRVLRGLAEAALKRVVPPDAEVLIRSGHPARQVAGEALRRRLVVLAAEGATPLERVARGGVSHYLMHLGEVPVLLVAADQPLLKLDRIGVAVDVSEAGRAAWRYAEALAEAVGAEPLAFHLVSLAPGTCCVPTYLPQEYLEEERVVQHAQKALREKLGIPEERLVVARGDEVGGLLDLAREHGVDLLVVGSKAKSSHRARIGRNVVELVYRADRPLLVVPEATKP